MNWATILKGNQICGYLGILNNTLIFDQKNLLKLCGFGNKPQK